MKDVPYIVFESEMARLERIIKKQFILIIVTILLLVGTNAYWIWYESQFVDEVSVTQDVDSGNGNGDAVINDGVRINGEGNTDSN